MKNPKKRFFLFSSIGALLAATLSAGCGEHLGLGIYCSENVPWSDAHPAATFGLTLVQNGQRVPGLQLGDGPATMSATIIETPTGGMPIEVRKSNRAVPYTVPQFGYVPCTLRGTAKVEVQSFSVTGSNGKTYVSETPSGAGLVYDQKRYALIGIDVTEK